MQCRGNVTNHHFFYPGSVTKHRLPIDELETCISICESNRFMATAYAVLGLFENHVDNSSTSSSSHSATATTER